MTFDEYEKAAMRTADPTTQAKALTLSALGICGEGGEFADLVKKHVFHEHQLPYDKLKEELGDILWYVTRACNVLGTTLEIVAAGNVEKLRQRYPDGFSSERSINRIQRNEPCSVCGSTGYHRLSRPNRGY